MRYIKYIIFLSFISIFSCKTSQNALKPYETDTLKIVPLSDNTFIHITYLQTESFGKVACNGLIFRKKNEAYIFDTPTNDTVSLELIGWVEKNLKCNVKGIVINHFHADCLGGLKAFHQKKIPSFANNKTIELAKKEGFEVPQNGFEGKQELKAGTKTIVNQFYGEGHTRDNIVSYIPSEKVLFGGCIIKEVGASFGFLGDANVQEWSNTVSKIKANLSDVRYVVPGHGKAGGVALLDYTIQKFKEKAEK